MVVTTTADLKAAAIPTDNFANVLGYSAFGDGGGGDFYYDASDTTSAENGGTIFTSTALGAIGRWKRLYSGDINVKWFGATGDGSTDDTDAIQKACSLPFNVFFPEGIYFLNSYVKLLGGYLYHGAGKDVSVIVQNIPTTPPGMGGNGQFYLLSDDPSDFIEGTRLADLGFNGQNNIYGAQEWTHLLALSGTVNTIIERCGFYNMRGDGINVGSGSDSAHLRSNNNVTIRDCLFDGGSNWKNRTGLVITNCDGILVSNNVFQNIGNTNLSFGLGAIDVERNYATEVTRNIKMHNNYFKNIIQTNQYGISLTVTPVDLFQISDIDISNNLFDNCYCGISAQRTTDITNERDAVDSYFINNNTFNNCLYSMIVTCKNGIIANNKFYGGGGTSGWNSLVNLESQYTSGYIGVGIKFLNNYFKNITIGSGCVLLRSIINSSFENNIFEKTTHAFYFTDSESDTTHALFNIAFKGNVVRNSLSYVFNLGNGWNSSLGAINSTIIDEDNYNSVNPFFNYIGLTGSFFNYSKIKADSNITIGTYYQGHMLYNGNYINKVIQSGSFGSLTIADCAVTNGSAVVAITNANILGLKIGHVITAAAISNSLYIITDINTTSFTLNTAYSGMTGTDTFSLSAPLFENI